MQMSPPPLFLEQERNAIAPINEYMAIEAQAHLDNLTKPKGSLGSMEDWAVQLFCIQKGARPLLVRPSRIFTVAGDHGVVAEGVAAVPQSVTTQMVCNFLQGNAAINSMCKTLGIELAIVDAGVNADLPEHQILVQAKIGYGTENIAKGPAMSMDACEKALRLGIKLANHAHMDNIPLVGIGEMGIGNSTIASALFCAYFGFSAGSMAGAGAGIPPKGLVHKAQVIRTALSANKDAIDSGNPVAILAALGGYEIATLAGLIIGCAARGIAVMVDGFISTAAFVAAWRIAPEVINYCFFSHQSAESGHAQVLESIGKSPLLRLGMRLGEGTGAALGISHLQVIADIFNNMATFSQAGVYTPR